MKTRKKKLKGSMSLTTILAIAFFTLSVLGLLVSSGLQIISYFQTQQQSITGKQQVIAREATGQVTAFILEKKSIMKTIPRLFNFSTATFETRNQVLDGLLGAQPSFRQLIMWDLSGRVLGRASRISLIEAGKSVNIYKDEILDYTKREDFFISPVFMDQRANEPMIFLSVAIRNVFNEIEGILAVEMNLKFMWDLMDEIKVQKTGYAYVVDKQGMLIAFRDSARVLKGEKLSNILAVSEFMQSKEGVLLGETYNYRGILNKDVLGTFVPLGTPDWAVITELPVTEAYQEVLNNIIRSLIITLFIALGAGIAGILIARRLSIPLIKLTETSTRIAGGEMELKAVVSGPREVASLANMFNNMTTQILNKAEEFRETNELLREIIDKAKEIIVNLNSSTKEIEAAAQEQTSASNENASGITEVSATLQELTITAKQITKNVGELVFSSEEVIKFLKESELQLEQIVSQLDDVGEISKKNTTEIGELGKRSVLINEMVELIKEVASKTNILSINASIEASRSSEGGSGFSVVAAEIRELSKETIDSAKKVEKAAKEIQDFLNSIIDSSKNESEKVINSAKIVKSIFDNIENIIAKINNNYSFTQKIDVSIKQQENGSIQAADTMKQMAEIARQSAETARQILLVVKDIVNFSMDLEKVITKFKNDETNGVQIYYEQE